MRNALCVVVFVIAVAGSDAFADNNSFFGANPGGSSSASGSGTGSTSSTPDYSHEQPEDSNPNAFLPGLNETTPTKPNNANDFTGDEKRMQKKYKANLANAQRLVERGTGMMKSAGNDVNSPVFKKGKILKEIGEKTLSDLKANNPFPDQKVK